MKDSTSSKSCCSLKNTISLTNTKITCPACNNIGKKVDIITIKALVKEGEISNIHNNTTYHYCANKNCKTVYFNENNSIFQLEQIKTVIGAKDPLGYICYCFGFKANDFRKNLDAETLIRNKIKEGLCACEVKNIHGSCCLGDVLKSSKDS